MLMLANRQDAVKVKGSSFKVMREPNDRLLLFYAGSWRYARQQQGRQGMVCVAQVFNFLTFLLTRYSYAVKRVYGTIVARLTVQYCLATVHPRSFVVKNVQQS